MSSICAPTVSEAPLHLKMSFLRKYIGALCVEFFLMSTICTLLMLSPLARFYVTENDWLQTLGCLLLLASYVSLVYCIKLPMIDLLLLVHILVLSCVVGVLVTFHDLMFVYQTVIITACTFMGFLLYTVQTKWNFSIWTIIIISAICISLSSVSLKAFFGGTTEEHILSVVITILLLIYHSYALFMNTITLSSAEYRFALVNAHILPFNLLAYSKPLYKP